MENAKYALDKGIHIESVLLIVTGANDDRDCIRWVIEQHVKYLGVETPLHINRYYPAYRYEIEPTPMETLKYAYEYARDGGV